MMPSATSFIVALAAMTLTVAPAAAAQSPATTVILVRHAEKADEPGADPALSPAGEARARALADALRDAKIAAVLTTPYKRTNLTAAPLAKAVGVAPVVVPVSGGLAGYGKAVADMIRNDYAGRTVVVVGHANTIPAVIMALGGPTVSDLCEGEYSTMYTLTLNGSAAPKLDTRHYGASDATGAASCHTMSMPLAAPPSPPKAP